MGAAFPEIAIPAAIGIGIEEKLRDLPKELEFFAEKVAASNKELALFSPVLGAAAMRLRFGDFQRELDLASQTGGTGAAQLDAVNRMREALHPIEVLGREFQNRAGGFAAGAVTGGTEVVHLADIATKLQSIMDAMPNAEDFGNTVAQTVMRSAFPGIGIMELVTDTLTAIRHKFMSDEAISKEQADAEKLKKDKAMRLDPWQQMLISNAGPGKIFPRLGQKPNNPTAFYQALDAKRHPNGNH